jgi:hypothetical protein
MSEDARSDSGTSPSRDALIKELTLVRTRGLGHLRDCALPTLHTCCVLAGVAGQGTIELHSAVAIEKILRLAVGRLGGDKAGVAAEFTFGLARGSKYWPAAERRRRATKAYFVSIERFRKGYEPKLIEYVADEILNVCALAASKTDYSPSIGPSRSGVHLDEAQSTGQLSKDLLTQLGRRRTAYSLDMSLDELAKSDLFVQPRISRYGSPPGLSGRQPITDLVRTLAAKQSCLLLGEPGAGKSLSLYWVAIRCAEGGRTPIVLRAQDAVDFFNSPAWERIKDGPADDVAVFIDGLDEALGLWERQGMPQRLIDEIARVPCLITSRTREFEESAVLKRTDVVFDAAYVLQDWSVDDEFKEYLDKLARAGLIHGTRLYAAVVRSTELTRLVSRPLYARMLTFVGGDSASRLSDPNSLYGEYVVKLARVADASLDHRGCHIPGGVLPMWKHTAWIVHEGSAATPGAVEIGSVIGRLRSPVSRECARSSVDQILDTRHIGDREVGEFVHYSFFEYLLASFVCDQLLRPDNLNSVAEVLRYDLSREVRHFLVAQLRTSGQREVANLLGGVLAGTNTDVLTSQEERLCAWNLSVYLLSRSFTHSTRVLTGLLKSDLDDFRRISVLWALCHLGSQPALDAFYTALEESVGWRALCRGYVLYYYGDISREDGPPYEDSAPHVLHLQTYERVLRMLGEDRFRTSVRPERRFIDIYTFLDILRVRVISISDEVHTLLTRLTEELAEDGIPDKMTTRLDTLIHNRKF